MKSDMKKRLFAIVILSLMLIASSLYAGTLTDYLKLYKPSYGEAGLSWWSQVNNSFALSDKYLNFWVDARVHGSTYDDATISSAIYAIGSAKKALLIAPNPSGNWAIKNDLTIPSNIQLILLEGSILEVATGKTLTINGQLFTGLYRIFSGSGDVIFGKLSIKEVYPEWWGAGGGAYWRGSNLYGTDSTTAIQKAIDTCYASDGGTVRIGRGYKVTSTINLKRGINLIGEAWYNKDGGLYSTIASGSALNPILKLDTASQLRIQNLAIAGGTNGITILNSAQIYCENVRVQGASSTGWIVSGGISNIFMNISATGCNKGIVLNATASSRPHKNLFIGGSATYNTSRNVEITDGSDIQFINFDNESSATGWWINAATRVSGLTLDNCWTENNSQAIDIVTASNTLMRGGFWMAYAGQKIFKFGTGADGVYIKNPDIFFDTSKLEFINAAGGSKFYIDGWNKISDQSNYTIENLSTDWWIKNFNSSIFVSFIGRDATPSVLGGNKFKTANTSATIITMFNDGYPGQEITIIFGDSNTTIDFTKTHLKGNKRVRWTPERGDHMKCVFDGSDWHCDVNDSTIREKNG